MKIMLDNVITSEAQSFGTNERTNERVLHVLIACEESQEVCKAFRAKGHEAYSCDIIGCSGGHPEWHIQQDVIPLLDGNCTFRDENGSTHTLDGHWDLIIAHPPCTYLTNGGAVRLFRKEIREYPPYGIFQMVNVDRLKKGIHARDFFMRFLNADCERIAIENPMPMSIFQLPKEGQVIQPFQFGDPYSKKTYLWLKGLPQLRPTEILEEYQPFINGGGGRLDRPNYKGKTFAEGSKQRSKTFHGIARAMADQWG